MDETIAYGSSDAADLDSVDEDEELVNEETILPPELELPSSLHGPANGRRGRASYYLPRPPAGVFNAANGIHSPYRYQSGYATNTVYEDNPSFSSLSPSKPGLSLKTRTFPHSRECEGDRAALVLNSPTQAIPQDTVDLESFGNGDIIVGVAGVPQDLGLGVICPLTSMPLPSSVPFLADEDDVEGQDIEAVLTDMSLSLADTSLSLAYQCVLVCFLLMLGSHLHILTLLTTQVALLFILVWAVYSGAWTL